MAVKIDADGTLRDTIDIGALDVSKRNTRMILLVEGPPREFSKIRDQYRLIVSNINHPWQEATNLSIEVFLDGDWQPVSLTYAAPLIAYVLRRAICRGLDKSDLVETKTEVTINLGRMP